MPGHGRFPSGRRRATHFTERCVGSRAGQNGCGRNLSLAGIQTPILQPVASRYIPASHTLTALSYRFKIGGNSPHSASVKLSIKTTNSVSVKTSTVTVCKALFYNYKALFYNYMCAVRELEWFNSTRGVAFCESP
jgi:hypothetical protein